MKKRINVEKVFLGYSTSVKRHSGGGNVSISVRSSDLCITDQEAKLIKESMEIFHELIDSIINK